MNLSTPQFDRPPVVETVLGVQFEPIKGLVSGHFGWYWREFLGPGWGKPTDAQELSTQLEMFGEQKRWGRGFAFGMNPAGADRFQVWNTKGDRLIQLQRTRFLYNWRKHDSEYPTYGVLRPEFDERLAKLGKFLASAELGVLDPNQWEVTYVNQILKDELWQSAHDWHKILPGLLTPATKFNLVALEDVNNEWHFEIPPERGRLHIALQSGRLSSPNGPETLTLKLTARGPILEGLGAGLDLGHEAIVQTFAEITSSEAQTFWKRRR